MTVTKGGLQADQGCYRGYLQAIGGEIHTSVHESGALLSLSLSLFLDSADKMVSNTDYVTVGRAPPGEGTLKGRLSLA